MHNTQLNHLLSSIKRIIQAKASNIELEQIKDEPKERRTTFQKLAAKGQCRNRWIRDSDVDETCDTKKKKKYKAYDAANEFFF